MKKFGYVFIIGLVFIVSGCGQLRFAATDNQKQNAWLHQQTAAMAYSKAKDQGCCQELLGLTGLCEKQSQAFVFDYGLPTEPLQCNTVEDMLAESNFTLAQTASDESLEKPDLWDLADNGLELAIGISGLLGGIYGIRIIKFLQTAKTNTTALKEIIKGNELLKSTSTEIAEEFKNAQSGQSDTTRQVVAEIKTKT